MIAYLVCSTDKRCQEEGERERGWTRLAIHRFATPEGDDIRAIRRIADLVPFAGVTHMLKGRDYDDGPEGATEAQLDGWIREKGEFDAFVASGRGKWVER